MVGSGTSISVCAKHGVETRLRCAECGKPICLRCQIRTAVGLKCEECAALPARAVRRRRRGSGMVMLAGVAVVLLVAIAVLGLLNRARGSGAPPASQAAVGSWAAVGDVPGIRGASSSVALRDRTVLIAGGGVGSIPLSGSATFDPATTRWTATGPLQEARRGNGMTSLLDGRVMVAGGVAGSTVLASAEVYDPAVRRWSLLAPMNTPRLDPILIGLADGRALAAGGVTAAQGSTLSVTADAEIFDPRTGSWTKVPPMLSPRDEASGVLLKDGRVLIVGGLSGIAPDSPPVAAAELFDPVVGIFTRTGAVRAPRHGHTATLLADGRVLVAGGSGSGSNLLSTELFDPGTGAWTTTGPMATGRHLPAATLLADGRVLAVGGETARNVSRASLRSAEIYSPATGRWRLVGSLSCPRSSLALSPLPGGGAIASAGDAAFPGEPPKAQSCAEIFRP